MKRILLFSFLTLIFVCPISGQIDFQEITANNLPAVSQGATALADVDGDNDLDLFITGNAQGIYIAKLFLNNGTGVFTEVTGTPFIGVSTSSVAFADIDGDNDQDVMYIGADSSFNRITKLYRNDGAGNYTEITSTSFIGVSRGAIAFSDIDSDLDLDLIISGEIGATGITKLYINDGAGNYTEGTTVPFIQVSSSAIKFSDIDNDNDNDVIITGFNGSYITKLYLNNGSGMFSEATGTPFVGVALGAIEFTDIDNDLDKDVIISGRIDNTLARVTNLYINDGGGNFSLDTSVNFEGVEGSSIGAIDIDNDNDIDVLLTGLNNANVAITKLYNNNGFGVFTETSSPFEGIQDSRIQLFADIDNDNDSDVFIFGSNFNAQVFGKIYRNIPLDVLNHPDYPALLAFYNSTNGANWTVNTNWLDLSKPISTWYGITETNGRVTEINLQNNQLQGNLPVEIGDLTFLNRLDILGNFVSGAIPTEIGNLQNLTWIDLRNNNFYGSIPTSVTTIPNLYVFVVSNNNFNGTIPDFTAQAGNLLDFLWIDNNNFQFGDFENEFTSYVATMGGNFVYNLQKAIDAPDDIVLNISESHTFNSNVSGNQNTYFWFKRNSGGGGNLLSNDQNFNLTINSTADYGDYWLEVTNTLIPNLILTSPDFTVDQNPTSHPDYNALVAFYNSTNGNSWTTNTNWLDNTKPVSTWYGVYLTNGRVTQIALGNNNLTGTLPTEIGNFAELQYLHLFSNQLTGNIPPEIGNLSNLIELDLAPNTFTGTIPTEIGNLTNLEILWLNQNGLSGSIPTSFQNLTNLRELYLIGSAGPPFSSSAFSGDFPDLTALPLQTLQIQRNYFTFNDIADEFATYQANITNFAFSPQYTVDVPENMDSNIGDDIVLNLTDVSPTARTTQGNRSVPNSYQWFKDNTPISGATTNSYTIVNAQAADSGIYYCEITNALVPNFIIRRADITVNIGVLNIDQNDISKIKIYPNPTNNLINISLPNTSDKARVSIYDPLGKQLLSQQLTQLQNSIELTHLQSGIYYLKIEFENKTTNRTIIKN